MSVTILGIDPSLTNTGLCWGDGPDGYETECLKFKPNKGFSGRELYSRMTRIDSLTDQARNIFNKTQPAVAMIESYSFASRNGGEYLGEYGGLLRHSLIRWAQQVIEVAPTAVKKFATGKGNAKKEVIIGHVQKRWGVLFENSDEADAYVLYRIGLCYAGICEPENQAQREVLAKLKGE